MASPNEPPPSAALSQASSLLSSMQSKGVSPGGDITSSNSGFDLAAPAKGLGLAGAAPLTRIPGLLKR